MNFKLITTILLSLLLTACYEKRSLENSSVKLGEKYVLQEWPDQAYVSSMDSMVKAELVVGPQKKSDVSVSLGTTPMALGEMAKKAVKEGQKLAAKSGSSLQEENPTQSLENFIESFSQNIEAVRVGSKKGRKIKSKAGENIRELLKRVYGAKSYDIPNAVVNYQLQGINPGKDLSAITEGTEILLPF